MRLNYDCIRNTDDKLTGVVLELSSTSGRVAHHPILQRSLAAKLPSTARQGLLGTIRPYCFCSYWQPLPPFILGSLVYRMSGESGDADVTGYHAESLRGIAGGCQANPGSLEGRWAHMFKEAFIKVQGLGVGLSSVTVGPQLLPT